MNIQFNNNKSSLPIDLYETQIQKSFEESNYLVLVADPGVGKSTRVPSMLLKKLVKNNEAKQILVLQPRRIAAKSIASRIANEENWTLGEEVGYQVRFDTKCRDNTPIKFVTEAILLQHLQNQESLKHIGAIVLDEFHERSLYSDLCIALTKELIDLGHDLKLLVMSASMDAKSVSSYLDQCEILHIENKHYPIDIKYSNKNLGLRFTEEHLLLIKQLILDFLSNNTQNHVLVFLPGKYEIEKCLEYFSFLKERKTLSLCALHSDIDLKIQTSVISDNSSQKIIFSTNISETSLTIESLSFVIDSGLQRISSFNPKLYTKSLDLKRVSRASALQRAGRAARQGPGQCFRLWTKLDEMGLPDYEVPEVLRADLSDTLNFLSSWGVSEWTNFSWYQLPTTEQFDSAKKLFSLLGAFESKNLDLTKKDFQNLSALPCEIFQAYFLSLSRYFGVEDLACMYVAILQEKKPRIHLQDFSKSQENDLQCILDLFDKSILPKSYEQIIKKVAKQIVQRLSQIAPIKDEYILDQVSRLQQKYVVKNNKVESKYVDQLIRDLFLISHLHLLSRRRANDKHKAKNVFGYGLSISTESALSSNSEYFLAIDMHQISGIADISVKSALNIAVDLSSIEYLFSDKILDSVQLEVDENHKMKERVHRKIFELEIGKEFFRPVNLEKQLGYLKQYALSNWPEILVRNQSLNSLYARINFLLNDDFEFTTDFKSEDFISEFLNHCLFSIKSVSELWDLDCRVYFSNLAQSEDLKALNKYAPEYLVSANKNFKINYSGEQAPFVEMKIQDAFYWKENPTVGRNKCPICFVLLAPNYRPTQITRDLKGFWSGSYAQVRKELKARYPKHDWPEKVE